MKFGLKQLAIGIVALFVIIGVIVMLLPVSEAEVLPSEANSHIYSLLVAANIEEALVDSTNERTIVSYDLSDNMEKEVSWFYVMGAVASVVPQSKRIEIQAFVNGEPTESITVQMADALDFANNRISEEEFRTKLQIV